MGNCGSCSVSRNEVARLNLILIGCPDTKGKSLPMKKAKPDQMVERIIPKAKQAELSKMAKDVKGVNCQESFVIDELFREYEQNGKVHGFEGFKIMKSVGEHSKI